MSENNNKAGGDSNDSSEKKEVGWGDPGALREFGEGVVEGTLDGLMSPVKWLWGGLGGDGGGKK